MFSITWDRHIKLKSPLMSNVFLNGVKLHRTPFPACLSVIVYAFEPNVTKRYYQSFAPWPLKLWYAQIAGRRPIITGVGRHPDVVLSFSVIIDSGGFRIWLDVHDDMMTWKRCPHYRPFVKGIRRYYRWIPLTKGQWCTALMFSFVLTCTNCWTNSRGTAI